MKPTELSIKSGGKDMLKKLVTSLFYELEGC